MHYMLLDCWSPAWYVHEVRLSRREFQPSNLKMYSCARTDVWTQNDKWQSHWKWLVFLTWTAADVRWLQRIESSIHYFSSVTQTIMFFLGKVFTLYFLIQMSRSCLKPGSNNTEPSFSLLWNRFLCDWINYVSLTLLEVSKHTFSVISHQSMWPWRWKVKHVSQEAGQRGISPLISGPNPITLRPAALRTEIIPMGYIQQGLYWSRSPSTQTPTCIWTQILTFEVIVISSKWLICCKNVDGGVQHFY